MLLLDAVVVAVIQIRGLVHRPSDAVLAASIAGGIALYGLNDVLVAAVAKIVVDDNAIEVRDHIGRRRRFLRTDVGHAVRRSVFAPSQSGINQVELLLIAKDGSCLTRLWEADYGSAGIEQLLETLGLKWPEAERATVRQVNRTFPGAHRFDYEVATVAILVSVAVVLALIAFGVLTH